MYFLDVGVYLTCVYELGDVLDHRADFVSAFACTQHSLEVLSLLDDHLSALDDLDTLFPDPLRRFDLRNAVPSSLTLARRLSSKKAGIFIREFVFH